MSAIPSMERVDEFLEERFVPPDPVLDEVLRSTHAEGMPEIQVSPLQGRLLYLLARACGARKILELGALAGYSTICLARALPKEGRLISLELEAKHAAVARRNIASAGLADRVEVRVGPALTSLAQVEAEGAGPFDLAFLDADKQNLPAYMDAAIRLGRPGSLLLVDNVIRGGAVIDPNDPDPKVQGVRRLFEALRADARVECTAIQFVGQKGHDGFAFAVVR